MTKASRIFQLKEAGSKRVMLIKKNHGVMSSERKENSIIGFVAKTIQTGGIHTRQML